MPIQNFSCQAYVHVTETFVVGWDDYCVKPVIIARFSQAGIMTTTLCIPDEDAIDYNKVSQLATAFLGD